MTPLRFMPLGKKLPRHDPRTLKLAKYIKALPLPPDQAGYVEHVKQWPMMLNDELGNCTVACAGHMIQQWSTYAGQSFVPSDTAVLKMYEEVSGYVPGRPETDNGAVVLDVLRAWRNRGLDGHQIKAFVSVNPRDIVEVKQAVHLFGNCYIGVGLPITAQGPLLGVNGLPCWSTPSQAGLQGDGAPYSWGGHAIPIVGYGVDDAGNRGTEVVTWGQVYDMTWDFMHNYCDEAWAVLSVDWFNKLSGISGSGFDFKTLEEDLAAL